MMRLGCERTPQGFILMPDADYNPCTQNEWERDGSL